MKKLIAILAAAVALFAFAPTQAEAGYRSKKVGTCSMCKKPIYSYYRPYRNSCGQVYYRWTTSHHSSCHSRKRSSYSRGPSVSFSIGFGSRSCYRR